MSADSDGAWRIAVAGGSLGGLCAEVALRREGYDVHIYERDPGPMNARGTGIVVQPELLDLLHHAGTGPLPTTSCQIRRYVQPGGGDGQVQSAPQAFTSWETIYATLRAAFPDERYHLGAEIKEVIDGENAVVAQIAGHGLAEADCLLFADGAQSFNRKRLLPGIETQYAGYVAWRGVLEEEATCSRLRDFFDDAFTFSQARSGGHMLVYFIPGANAATGPGKRRLNWVWYVRVAKQQLAGLLLDRDGRQHRASLSPGSVAQETIDELIDHARREVHPQLAQFVAATPDPFLQTIVDVEVPKTVFGRICLIGDAAFEGMALAASLKRARARLDVGLDAFEREQIKYGTRLTNYGIGLGREVAAVR